MRIAAVTNEHTLSGTASDNPTRKETGNLDVIRQTELTRWCEQGKHSFQASGAINLQIRLNASRGR